MNPEKSSLSIRLIEPVVPLRVRSAPERTFRHEGDSVLPPAIVRGHLALKLTKPTKISSIELKLQAKASTRYTQGAAGPGQTDITERYKVHSASTVVFVSQGRRRATSTRPGVQSLDDHTGSTARHGTGAHLYGVGRHGHAPPDLVTRSASLDPLWVRRRFSSDGLEIGHGSNLHGNRLSADPAPPYTGPADHRSFLSVDSGAAERSQSVASSSRTTESQSSPILSQSSLVPHGSPASRVHSMRGLTLSRTSSIEEAPEDESESSDGSTMHSDRIAYHGPSRIRSSDRSPEQDYRGRSRSRFSFEKVVHVFEAVKDRVRSRSPRARSRTQLDDQEERGRSLMKGKGKAQVGTLGVHALSRIGTAEFPVADGANNQSGDGSVFPEGTYIYPVFFTIPNDSPPTMRADHGSLIWKIKAEVKRPGAFKSKMVAYQEVVVVCVPTGDDSEEVEEIDLQRQWEGQLQYRIHLAGRSIPVGGKIPFQLTLMPSEKVKIHSILVYLDELTEYYARTQTRARSDAIRRATLLVIRHSSSGQSHSKPILPLTSDEPNAFRRSPLYRFLRPGEDESEVASSFMGPGPWTICHQLKVPESCSILYPSNQAKRSNVMVNHTLKVALRVEKEESTATTGKKLYDIVIHIPIQILSCHCTSEWSSLPRYDEALHSESDTPEDMTTCPCHARLQAKSRTHSHTADTLPLPSKRVSSPSDYANLGARLISGPMSERGEAPPSYEYSENSQS